MKKLDIYIIRSFLGPFFVTFFVVLFLFVMQFLWLYIDDIMGKGLSVIHILKLLIYMSASFVPMTLPLSILIASIMSFGDLSEKYEMSAIKSSGISLSRTVRGLSILIVILSLGSFWFSNNIVPYSNFQALNLLSNIRTQKPALNLKEGVFENSIPGFSIKVGKKNEEKLSDIIIYEVKKNKNTITVAESGIMKKKKENNYMEFELFNGYSYEMEVSDDGTNRQKQSQYSTKFKRHIIYFDLLSFNLEKLNNKNRKNEYSMLNIVQINEEVDNKKKKLALKNDIIYKDFVVTSYKRGQSRQNNQNDFENIAKDSATENIDIEKILLSNIDSSKINSILSDGIEKINSSITYLNNNKTSLKSFDKMINRYIMEIHRKYSLAFSCIIMFFIGAPFGAIIRKGGMGLPIVFSVLIFIVYQILIMTTERMGYSANLDPVISRWLPSVILSSASIWLTYKATTDSPILNSDKYFRPFYWILDYIKKKKGQKIYFERDLKNNE